MASGHLGIRFNGTMTVFPGESLSLLGPELTVPQIIETEGGKQYFRVTWLYQETQTHPLLGLLGSCILIMGEIAIEDICGTVRTSP